MYLEVEVLLLKERGIRRGVEVFVKDPVNPNVPIRKGRVINTYPHPSNWLVVKLDDGNMIQVEGRYVTTMYESNKRRIEL